MNWTLPILLIALGLALLCGQANALAQPVRSADAPAKPVSFEARGKDITQQAFALLSANLGKALAEGGVTNALSYCSEKALPLTQLVADTNQVHLRRVTQRPRNPANRADTSDSATLRAFQAQLAEASQVSPVVRTNADGSVTFFAPIVLNNTLCLRCHGEVGKDIWADNAAFIRSLYPRDEATGFKLGQLRGMWRIDFLQPTAMPAR
jgi:hypothetical protein